MKKTTAWVLLLAGCAGSGGGKMSEEDFETKLASSIYLNLALVKVGEHATYFVKKKGEPETQRYSWAVVGEQAGTLWIEHKVPFGEISMIVKTRLERSGKVLEQWVGDPGGAPGQTYPNPRQPEVEPKPFRDSSTAKAEEEREPDRIVVIGKPYDCTKVTTKLSYPDGRKSTMINWFSKEVPLASSQELGGLLKRQFGRFTMEFAGGDFKGARPELLIPPK